jgi:hypothetical protein
MFRCRKSFHDETTAVRGLLASGVAERAIRNSGETAVEYFQMGHPKKFNFP